MFGHYPTDTLLSLSIFGISLWMLFIFRTNIIMTIFSLELLLLSNILGFSISAAYLNDIVGEVFSLYIIVIAAVETAIALCIVISYYRVTNNYINIKHEFTDAFLSGFLLLQIAGKSYDVFTMYNIILAVFFVVSMYYATVGFFMDVIPIGISIYYNTENFFVRERSWVSDFMRLAYPEYLYLFKTPAPNAKRDAYLRKLTLRGYSLQRREVRICGIIWSILDREFIASRFVELTDYYYGFFGHPELRYTGYKMARWELRHHTWYYRYVARYTSVGQAYFAKHMHYIDQVILKKEYELIIKNHLDEIERLNAVIRVKDVYIDMYNRKIE